MHNRTELKDCLERLYRTYDRRYLSTDPLEFVHRFTDRKDREIAALVCSSLAYGQVATIRKNITVIMDIMGWEPYRFTMKLKPLWHRKLFNEFRHRFSTGLDVLCLLYYAKQMISGYGSIGGFFFAGYNPDGENIKDSLISFSKRVLDLDSTPVYRESSLAQNAGVRFFFPSPAGGSACKRLNLMLRWMVRCGDKLDLGIWTTIDPAKLVIPLDTHVERISRKLGLSDRKTADWKMAEEITSSLRELDPLDPIKYDFSLARLGILDECPRKVDPDKCAKCPLSGLCVLY